MACSAGNEKKEPEEYRIILNSFGNNCLTTVNCLQDQVLIVLRAQNR